ncbi:MAG: ABC transporter permease [Acidimicrobiales bacterium]
MTAILGRPINPVLGREVKERFRGIRGWIMLSVYLALLAAVLFLAYQAAASGSNDPFAGPSAASVAVVGRAIFEWLVLFMVLLVLFLVPAMTSGAIAGERERQTLVPVQVTLMSPLGILLGKLGASLAFVTLLVFASLPFLAITYLVGGVTITNVIVAIASVLFVAIVVACVGVACSSIFRRVQPATVIAYAVVLALVAGTFVAYGTWWLIDEARGTDTANRAPAEFLLLNPLALVGDAVTTEDSADGSFLGSIALPLGGLDQLILESRARGDLAGDVVTEQGFAIGPNGREILRDFGSDVGDEEPIGFDRFNNPIFPSDVETPLPFWVESVIAFYVLAVLAMFIGTRRLRTPAVAER